MTLNGRQGQESEFWDESIELERHRSRWEALPFAHLSYREHSLLSMLRGRVITH